MSQAQALPAWPPWLKRPPTIDELVTEDGEPMETWRHREQMNLLIHSLELHWADRDDFFVSGNMFLYFSALQAKKNDFRGPDVFVVLGTERRERKAWVVWEEDGRVPDIVIELTSESSEAVDRGEKMRIYGRVLHVPEYYIYDPFSGELEGHASGVASSDYVRLEPGEQGRLCSEGLGLELGVWQGTHLGVEAPWLRWHTPEGALLPTAQEHAAEAEQGRAEAEQGRAEAEQGRVEAEQGRAEAEARAESLEARLAAYEGRFGPLTPGG